MSAGKTTSFLSAVAILFPKASSLFSWEALLTAARAVNMPRHGGKHAVPRAVSDKSARSSGKSVRSSDKSARRNDDAPPATDVFDAGQCDISANYKHALHHETFKGCSIN